MDNRISGLFFVSLLIVASLNGSEACKKCGNPMCHGLGIGISPKISIGFGGHPLLGHVKQHLMGGHACHPLFGGFGGHGMGGGIGECAGGCDGGYDGGFGGGYPVPVPVAVPIPMPHPYPMHNMGYGGMGPMDGGCFDDDYIPRKRPCRCHHFGHGRRQHAVGRGSRDYY